MWFFVFQKTKSEKYGKISTKQVMAALQEAKLQKYSNAITIKIKMNKIYCQ